MVRLNEKLIQARKSKKLTQEQVSILVGIDRSTYAHYERGRPPQLDTALKIAQVLGRPVEDLFLPIAVLKQHKPMSANKAAATGSKGR